MAINKAEILKSICYTELVYGRINKKLKSNYSKHEIEKLLFTVINETEESCFIKVGKNFYVTNAANDICITINSSTFRVITVDRVLKIKGNA